MIKIQSLNKNYITQKETIPALSNINISIERGEIFGIIGKSGAGKSTLLRCVNLLEYPSCGSIQVDNQELTRLNDSELRVARRKIGMIFQHFNLLSSRTVYENIALPLELNHYSRQKKEAIIMPLLEMTGLADKKNVYPNQLSGGQKQRVGIARALVHEPHVLLSDEATSALDPETTLSILTLLKDIRDRLNVTILLITHEMSVIKACCDRVGILEKGRLIEENTVGDFFIHPKTHTARQFVSSTLTQHLPMTLAHHILPEASKDSHPLLRLFFLGQAATQPIISQLINQFGLKINILQANVEYIHENALGTLILAIDGKKETIEKSIDYLERLEVRVEIIGHVRNDIIAFT